MRQSTISERTGIGQPISMVPGRGASELLIAFAVFAAAMLYLWPLRAYLAFNADEGVTLSMAERIVRGQLPYRDFFTFFTPCSAYLMALWFKLFGVSYLVARTILLGYAGIFAAITYRLARRIVGRSAALWAAALLVCGCMPARFVVLHNWDSTMFSLVAIYCAHLFWENPGSTLAFLLGSATALTCLTEQSKGAGLVLGLAIAMLVLRITGHRRFPISLRHLWWGAAGFALPVVVTCGYFASQHAVRAMLDAWLWPLHHYSSVNRTIFGALSATAGDILSLFASGSWLLRSFTFLFVLPMLLISAFSLVVLGLTVYAIAIRWRTSPSRALDTQVLGGCIFLGIFLATLSTRRTDLNHILYLAPLFLYLLPSIFQIDFRGVRLFRETGPIAAGLLLVLFSGFGFITLGKAIGATTKIETARGMVRVASPDEVLSYVRTNVPAGGHVYVHPYQALYSFMTGTVNPTHMIFLFRGMDTPEEYQTVVADLAADQPPVVLLNPNFSDYVAAIWPSTPAEALANDPVENYILQHYRTCRVLNSGPQHAWSFYYMVRLDLSCPAQAMKPE